MKSHDRDTLDRCNRRNFLRAGLLAGCTASAKGKGKPRSKPDKSFPLEEATIADLRRMIDTKKRTIRQIVRMYLERIHAIDKNGPTLRSVIEINPDAEKIAKALDAETAAGKKRGPLHGIPILIKDNIDTADKMASTSGSLALADAAPPEKDAFLIKRLRKAGAVILGKTNLSEWAEMRSSYCVGGWSGRGGLTRNPYSLDRNPSGSSSGSAVAVAASLCAVAVGTETSSSIVRPASVNGVVGIKPTVGLVSRRGLIPLALSQDTAGPMARTVADAAILLDALAGFDPGDSRVPPALAKTAWKKRKPVKSYTSCLKKTGLHGKRVGVVRNFCGIHEDVDRLMKQAIGEIKKSGATIVDPANLDKRLETPAQWFGDEFTVLMYEFKHDLNAYLKTRKARPGQPAIPGSLEKLIVFNRKHERTEMPHFGQDIFESSQAKGPLTDKAYREALKKNWKLSREDGIDGVMTKHKLDVLIAPTEGPAWLTDFVGGDHFRTKSTSAAAIAGYPSITVPMGNVHGLPVGLSFFGQAWSEPKLIEAAFAFENSTPHRKKPTFPTSVNPWS